MTNPLRRGCSTNSRAPRIVDQIMVYSIVNDDPVPLTALRTGVPTELERIVNKALNKSKEERYQQMDEMLVDLKALSLKVRKDSGYRLEKEGLTESLITSLSQISNFKVISRISVFHYKGQQIEIQKVARELKVNKLLLGWVNQGADNVSIGVELVEGSDNSQIWGEQYTRKFTNVVKIQEEVVKDISTKLKLKLTRKEKNTL